MPNTDRTPSPAVEIYYDDAADLLSLCNGRPEHREIWLSQDCTVLFDRHPDAPAGILIWLAQETLSPLLSGETAQCAGVDGAVTTYDQPTNTLWIRNGRPALTRREIFEGCSLFFDAGDFPAAVALTQAAELLLPVWQQPAPEPERPRIPALTIHYYPEDDFLSVGNGLPDGGGFDLCAGCIVLFGGYPENPVEFIHDNAAELLLPALTGGAATYQSPYDDEIITYDPDTDTLRLQNGRPTQVQRDIFEGCSVFFDDKEFVSAIVLAKAAALLTPVLTAEPDSTDLAIG